MNTPRTTEVVAGRPHMPWPFTLASLAAFLVLVVAGMAVSSSSAVDPRWLGIQVEPMSADAAQALGLQPARQGVLVADVQGLGARAGVQEGDIIVAVNGELTPDVPAYASALEMAAMTGDIQLQVLRGGMALELRVDPDATGTGLALGHQTPGPTATPVAWIPRCYRRPPCPQREGTPAALTPCQTCPTAPGCIGAGAGGVTQVAWPRRPGPCPLNSTPVALPAPGLAPSAGAAGANPCVTCPQW